MAEKNLWNVAVRSAVACYISEGRKAHVYRRNLPKSIASAQFARFALDGSIQEFRSEGGPNRFLMWMPSAAESPVHARGAWPKGCPKPNAAYPDIVKEWCCNIDHCLALVTRALKGEKVPHDIQWVLRPAKEFFDNAFDQFPDTQEGVDLAMDAWLMWMDNGARIERGDT